PGRFAQVARGRREIYVGEYRGCERAGERPIAIGKREFSRRDGAYLAVELLVAGPNVDVPEPEPFIASTDICLRPVDHSRVAVEAGVGGDRRAEEVAGNPSAAAPDVEEAGAWLEHLHAVEATGDPVTDPIELVAEVRLVTADEPHV